MFMILLPCRNRKKIVQVKTFIAERIGEPAGVTGQRITNDLPVGSSDVAFFGKVFIHGITGLRINIQLFI